VREHDPDRFLTCLFAPTDRREALFALYAFNIELARIREIVTEPMMGQIRLQWWREALADLYEGRVRGHQVLQAMAATIPNAIDQDLLQDMIDAREMDLQEEPPVSDIAVKHYARATGGALMQAAAMLLGVKDRAALDAAAEIGEAVTLVGLLRSIPYHAAQGKSFIPSTLLRKLNIPAAAPHKAPEYGIEIVTMLIAHEAERLLHDNRPQVSRDAIAAFLPGRLASGYIRRLTRLDFDPFRPENLAPSPLKPLDLAWAWAVRAA
jgi:phytoene synthase